MADPRIPCRDFARRWPRPERKRGCFRWAGSTGVTPRTDEECGRSFAPDWAGIPLVRELRCSSGLTRALRELAPKVDVIHDHGLWLMPNVEAGRAALAARKPFIVAPHGMLSPTALSFSRLKKRVVWALLQGDVVRRASCIHVTSEQEHDEIRDFGLQNPIAIIPNGIDIPELDSRSTATTDIVGLYCHLGGSIRKKDWIVLSELGPGWNSRILSGGCVSSAPTNSATPENSPRWPRN